MLTLLLFWGRFSCPRVAVGSSKVPLSAVFVYVCRQQLVVVSHPTRFVQ